MYKLCEMVSDANYECRVVPTMNELSKIRSNPTYGFDIIIFHSSHHSQKKSVFFLLYFKYCKPIKFSTFYFMSQILFL